MSKLTFVTPYTYKFSLNMENPSQENLTEEGMAEDVNILVERFLRNGVNAESWNSYIEDDDISNLEVPDDILSDPDADLVDAWQMVEYAHREYERLRKNKTRKKTKSSDGSPSAETSNVGQEPPEESETAEQ